MLLLLGDPSGEWYQYVNQGRRKGLEIVLYIICALTQQWDILLKALVRDLV